MKLFSKRNKNLGHIYRRNESFYSANPLRRHTYRNFDDNKELVNKNARSRLVSIIKFFTSSDNFLEKYILVDDRKGKIHYFNKKLLDDFSESELGYKFSDNFVFYPFAFLGNKIPVDEEETMKELFNDYLLFDLLETMILFSSKKKRGEVIFRINKILQEEKTGFVISKNIITKDSGEDLRSIVNQLKDNKLSSKIVSYYDFFANKDYINACKVSADIVNIILSDESIQKKKAIKNLQKEISSSIVINSKEKDKRITEFENIISEYLKNINSLNNGVFDVRHSEKDRIEVSNEYLYKLICSANISFVELALTSLKDNYIAEEDWEKIKEEYIENYKINKDNYYYVPDPEDIDPEDIPF